jgi:hypothetical protein
MTALAGSFSTDFSSYTGFSVAGVADIFTNRVVLTPAVGSQSGSITLEDLDAGQPIESFTATFKLQLGPGSGNAADGVSLNFGPDIYPGLISSEEGPGGSALTISFDPYDNGAGEAPAVDIKYGGAVVAHHAFAKSDMVTSQLEDVIVQVTRNARVTVTYKGQVIHDNVLVFGWGPTAGTFNFSGRTGGEYEEQDIAALSITTVLQGAATAPSITSNPQNATANEGGTATFTVGVDGTAPLSVQWYKNNSPIQDATNLTLTLGPVYYTDNNAKLKATVTNPASSATSTEATLTVVKDTTAPTVVKANADVTGTQVTVVFSEPVNDTALTPSNYGIDQGIIIAGVTRVDASRVVLSTDPMPGGRSYVISIHGVQDMASSPPNTMVATQITFKTYLFQVGAVVHKKYANLGDGSGSLNALKNDPRYPNNPDRQDIMTSVEYPANGSYRDTVADPRSDPPPIEQQYSDTLECYFTPPTTNDYVFYTTGADINDVYLSTDADPANMVNIAKTDGWTNPRDWMVSQCGTVNGLRSDAYTGNAWPGAGDPFTTNALIHLDGGQRYYLFAFHHRFTWSGADDFAVTYTYAGAAQPASGTAPVLTGSQIGTYLDPTGASVSFSQQPASVTILQGRTATFSGLATGQSSYGTNVVYQWQSAPTGSSTFTDIAGAVNASYTTPALGVADSGRQYRLLASVPGLSQPSSIATVTVNADTIAPKLVTAAALPSRTGATFDVGLTFDEPLDATSAGAIGNYSISAGTISAVKYYAGSPGVVLTVSGLTSGGNYTVGAVNVADPYGNPMTSSSLPLTFSTMQWGVVGGDELQLGNGVVAVAADGFDVYSDGLTEWAAYDETTFVYEQVTGDFDKKLRVEFQDASSQWARAGLIARDVPNFGVDRNGQTTNSLAGRYQKVHVSPVVTAMGTPGNNTWEGNRRLTTGGQSTSAATTGGGAAPQYPNAWCRLQRVGQTFTIYRSDNGTDWVQLGQTTATDWGAATPMPDTLYVGPEFSPENGNVAAGLQGVFVAKFRNYGNNSVAPPVMSYQRTASGMRITFEGTLQSADTIGGTWTDMTGTISPYDAPIGATQKYYRAKK